MKKKIVLSLSIVIGIIVNGQVAIGKEVSNSSALLDFEEDTKSGIILPYIPDGNNLPERATTPNGMIFYYCPDNQVYFKSNDEYHQMTFRGFRQEESVCKNNTLNETGDGVIIGADTSNAKGVLVLESNNKALLLPKVANAYLEIKSPEPGTLVYDPTNKVLSVYNGRRWTFWTNE